MIGRTISHFEILDRIGRGGMGVVYKARDLELDRFVAVKFLADEIGGEADAVERFMREAKAASSLDHPNICTIHEIGRTEDGSLFIVMALYGGDTLSSRMNAGISVDESINFATQIARGLAAAHERGIVHRDVKPSNIVLTERGRAVILDFGLATLPGVLAITKTGSTVGTAPYMSPEQLQGVLADSRSDIWSLGVLLYEMVNGKRPFEGAYEQAVSYAIVNQDPEPSKTDGDPRLVRLREIIMRCLVKDPESRYQDALELATDLEVLSSPTSPTSPKADTEGPTAKRGPALGRLTDMRGVLAAVVAIVAIIAIALAVVLTGSPTDPEEPAFEDRPVLLILPFENLGDAGDAFLATGVSDEITGRLSTIASLAVISRRSAAQYAETDKSTAQIGAELGVDYILEGQVRWASQADGESRVRISPMLIRVSDDTQLWAASYDRGIDDIFSIQADVATRVAAELDARLSPADRDLVAEAPTGNVVAYEVFLRGRALYWDQDLELAATEFNAALALDPDFVQAAYMLARTYSFDFIGSPGKRDELGPLAQEATERVASMAPGSPEAHLASGNLHYYVERNYDRALEDFDVAVAARPGDDDAISARAYVLRRLMRLEDAADELHRALRIDPNNEIYLTSAAKTHQWLRQFDVADSLLSIALELDPLDATMACRVILNRLAWKGLTDDVIARSVSRLPDRGSLPDCRLYGVDMAQRNYAKILGDLESLKETPSPEARSRFLLTRAVLYRYAGNKEAEVADWKELLSLAQDEAAKSPHPGWITDQAYARAGLGDKESTVVLIDSIAQLIANDRLMQLVEHRHTALMHTLVGNKKQAIEILRSDLSAQVGVFTVHHLEMPHWDSLREEPEFLALLESQP